MFKKSAVALTILIATAAPAFAHLDPGQHGSLAAGLSHPLFGIDHILAMLAVGLWAALLGGRALALVPATFLGLMGAGFAAAVLGLPLPLLEPVILASVVVVGLLAATALKVPSMIAIVLVGCLAFFHGHAHGGELGAAGAFPFAAGFLLSTALLHLAGMAAGLAPPRLLGSEPGRKATRMAGALTALGGLWLAFGA